MSGGFYTWLKEVRCTTAREVAERLGISLESARGRLKRLERRGVLEKRFAGRVAMYCVKEGATPQPSRKKGPSAKTAQRAERAVELLAAEGCMSGSALLKALEVGHGSLRHVLMLLISSGRAVEVVVGKTAIWCRDRSTAEELISRLRAAAHRLASSRRFVRPFNLIRMAQRDREAYVLFSKFVPLSRLDDDSLSPQALAFADGILRSLYGEPIRYSHSKHVYAVLPQPRAEHGIAVRDAVPRGAVGPRRLRHSAVRRARRRGQETVELMQRAEELIGDGCIAAPALARRLGITRSRAFYVLYLLQSQGRVVKAVVGRAVLWCRDADAAQRFLEEVKARLAEQYELKPVAPKCLYELVAHDAEARELFSRVVDVERPSTYIMLKELLKEYVLSPPDLAATLGGVDTREAVLQAADRLLVRRRA